MGKHGGLYRKSWGGILAFPLCYTLCCTKMIEGQVVESLLLDYSLSFQLDIYLISTKQSLAMVLHILFFLKLYS